MLLDRVHRGVETSLFFKSPTKLTREVGTFATTLKREGIPQGCAITSAGCLI